MYCVIENDHCGLFFCLQNNVTHVGYKQAQRSNKNSDKYANMTIKAIDKIH